VCFRLIGRIGHFLGARFHAFEQLVKVADKPYERAKRTADFSSLTLASAFGRFVV